MCPTPFWRYFDVSYIIVAPRFTFWRLVSWFVRKCAPCLGREPNSKSRHKAVYIKNLTLSTSKRPRLTQLLFFLAPPWPSWPFKKSFKNQHFFSIFAFGPHQARTYTLHMCHLRPFDVEMAHIRLHSHPHAKSDPKLTPKSPQSSPGW